MDAVFKCNLCQKSFVSLSALCQHTEMTHAGGEVKACLNAQPEPDETMLFQGKAFVKGIDAEQKRLPIQAHLAGLSPVVLQTDFSAFDVELVDDRKSDVLNPPPSDIPLDEKEGVREDDVVEGKDEKKIIQRPNSPQVVEGNAPHPLLGVRFRNLHEQMVEMKERIQILENDRQIAQELQDDENIDEPDLRVRPLNHGFGEGVDAGLHVEEMRRDHEYADEVQWAQENMMGVSFGAVDFAWQLVITNMIREARKGGINFFAVQSGFLIGNALRFIFSDSVTKIVKRLWCLLPLLLILFIFMRLPTSKACLPTAEAFDVLALAENPNGTSLLTIGLVFLSLYALSWTTYKIGVGAKGLIDSAIDHMSSKANQVVSSAMKNAAKTGGEILLHGATIADTGDSKKHEEKEKCFQQDKEKCFPLLTTVSEVKVQEKVILLSPAAVCEVATKKQSNFLDAMSWISDLALVIMALQTVYEAAAHYFSSTKKEERKKESLQGLVDVAAVAMAAPAYQQNGWSGVLAMMKWLFSSLLAVNSLSRGTMSIAGCVFQIPDWVRGFTFPDFSQAFSLFPVVKQSGFTGWFRDFYDVATKRITGQHVGSNDSQLLALQKQDSLLDQLEIFGKVYYSEAPKNLDPVAHKTFKDSHFTIDFLKLYSDVFATGTVLSDAFSIPAQAIFEEQLRTKRVLLEADVMALQGDTSRPTTIKKWLSRVLNLRDETIDAFKTPAQISLLIAFIVFCAYLWWVLNPKRNFVKKDSQSTAQTRVKESDLGKRGYDYNREDDVSIRDEERKFKYEQQRDEDKYSDEYEGPDEGDMHYNRRHRDESKVEVVYASHDSKAMKAAKSAQLRVQQQAEEQKLREKYGKSWADLQDEEDERVKESRTSQEIEADISERKKRVDAALLQLSEVEQKLTIEKKTLIAEQDKIVAERQALSKVFAANQEKLAVTTKHLTEVRTNEVKSREDLKFVIEPMMQELAKLRQEIKEQKDAKKVDVSNLDVVPETTANKIRIASKESKMVCQICQQVASHSVDFRKGKVLDARSPYNALLKECKNEVNFIHFSDRVEMFQHLKKNQRTIPCPFAAKCNNGEGKCRWLCHAHVSQVVSVASEPLKKKTQQVVQNKLGKVRDPDFVTRSAYVTQDGVARLPYVLSTEEVKETKPVTYTREQINAMLLSVPERMTPWDYFNSKREKESRVTNTVTQVPLDAHTNSGYVKSNNSYTNCTIVANSALVSLHWWRALSLAQRSEAQIIWGLMKANVAPLTKYEFERWEDGSEADLVRIMLPVTWMVPKLKMLPFSSLQINDQVNIGAWRPNAEGTMLPVRLCGASVGLEDGYGAYQINTENGDCGAPVMKSFVESWRIVGIHNNAGSSVNGCIYLDDVRWKQLMVPKNASLGQSQRQ